MSSTKNIIILYFQETIPLVRMGWSIIALRKKNIEVYINL